MLASHPIESRSAGETRLAAAVVRAALEDATAGDPGARAFVTSPRRLTLWSQVLRVDPVRLAELARGTLHAALNATSVHAR